MVKKLGRPLAYPWDDWFGRRKKFRLVRGKDFNCAPYIMSQQIRTEARLNRNNTKVSILIIEDVLVVDIIPQRQRRRKRA